MNDETLARLIVEGDLLTWDAELCTDPIGEAFAAVHRDLTAALREAAARRQS